MSGIDWFTWVKELGVPVLYAVAMLWYFFRTQDFMKTEIQSQLDVIKAKIVLLNNIDQKAEQIKSETAAFREAARENWNSLAHDETFARQKLMEISADMDKSAETLLLMAKGISDSNQAQKEMVDLLITRFMGGVK